MDKVILYIHGKDGSPEEAEYYKPLFGEYEVIGFDYASQTPWERSFCAGQDRNLSHENPASSVPKMGNPVRGSL